MSHALFDLSGRVPGHLAHRAEHSGRRRARRDDHENPEQVSGLGQQRLRDHRRPLGVGHHATLGSKRFPRRGPAGAVGTVPQRVRVGVAAQHLSVGVEQREPVGTGQRPQERRGGLRGVDVESLTQRAGGLRGGVQCRVYRALGLSGYARMDFRRDASGKLYLLEANPNPQLAYGEDFAESAEHAGIPYPELMQRILNLGLRWRPAGPE